MGQELKKEEKWILAGIPVLFLLGTLFHFLYDFSGQNPLVGLVAATNESVWEHGKMVVLPTVLFWAVLYLFKGKEYKIDPNKWFTAALAALITMILTIPLLFYFYTGAFGVELLWVDILILLLANLFGQLVGLHIYRYGKAMPWYLAAGIMICIILLYAYFTNNPPQLPMFMESLG